MLSCRLWPSGNIDKPWLRAWGWHIAVWGWPKTWLGSSPCVPGRNATCEIDGNWLLSFAFKVDLNQWLNNEPIIDRTIKTWLPEQRRNGWLIYWPYDWQIIDRTISKWLTEQWTQIIARTATTLDLSSSLVNKYFPKAEWMVTLSGRTGGQTDGRGVYTWPPTCGMGTLSGRTVGYIFDPLCGMALRV